jgi:hypothetical protein
MATHFVYEDNEVRRTNTNPIPYMSQPAVKYWATHFGNSMYLTFLVKNEPGFVERNRAQHELNICERKMQYWQNHPNWEPVEAGREADKIRKMWVDKKGR